jgi:hypothetical protein
VFVEAIEKVSQFTRPIHIIARYWEGGETIEPGTATLFFVNDQGWALTCKHVAQVLFSDTNKRFQDFKAARDSLKTGKRSRSAISEIGKKFGYKKGVAIEVHSRLVNCAEGKLELEWKLHPTFDVALLKFKNYAKLLCDKFPVFAKDVRDLKQGKFLCHMGFPFPEFTNFEYDNVNDRIGWTNKGRIGSPSFPIEGMVTRHLAKDGERWGFELSTPGLRGQSGGPAFDVDGRIWGMQAATKHLDLQFDVNKDVFRSGRKEHVTDYAFLRVGRCVDSRVIKDFLRIHSVDFAEA